MALAGTNTNVITMTSAADTITGKVILETIRWIGTTAGDDLIIDDSAGNLVFQSKAETNNFTDSMSFSHMVFDGLVIDTIDSGTVYVYRK